jgi:hypothetical protein
MFFYLSISYLIILFSRLALANDLRLLARRLAFVVGYQRLTFNCLKTPLNSTPFLSLEIA